jgi:lipoprotein-anchoring transpeptidase ErfK/SrfK
VRLYTRYRTARSRQYPWRFWLALTLLSAGIYGWLHWEPREQEQPQDLLLGMPDDRELAKPSPSPASSEPQKSASPAPDNTASATGGTNSRAGVVPAAAPDTNSVVNGEGRPVENLFEAQLALARLALSPGSLDGVFGSRTRNALRMFQQREQLPASGELDARTRRRLILRAQPYTNYVVTVEDLGRLLPVGTGWVAKSEQPRLDYAGILELVAERSWSHPDFVSRLNPLVDWGQVMAGTKLLVPNVSMPEVTGKAALVRIQLGSRFLQVFDDKVNLMAHFPCTIARSVDRRPLGELRVDVMISMPNYTFDPTRFAPTAETRGIENKLILPPGPNNPVGTVWIGLNRSGYGIHGTPEPEKVGGAESLGCFRLSNWCAEHLLKLVWVGMPVHVEP